MLNEKIDFSRLERITPRADSWEKVCARIDAKSKPARNNIIPFRILSAIPLAASIALVSVSVLMTAFSATSESVSINSIAPAEVSSWYSNLGGNHSLNSTDEDFATLDETVSLSYFYKEAK